MELETAKEVLKDNLTEYVQSITAPSKGRGMYVCPLCGSGTGPNRSGAFSIDKDGKHWKCFACNEGGDIFDLIGKYERIDSYIDQIQRAGELFNVSVDVPEKPVYTGEYTHKHMNTNVSADNIPAVDYTDFFLQANKHIEETTYHRDISLETLNRFKIGYVAEWKHPNAEGKSYVPATPRMIIPTSKTSYIARDTREHVPEEQKTYSKQKVGKTHLFNVKALQTADKPICIVEGELDALSIIDVGGEAIGLGSTSMINQFLEAVKENSPAYPLVIALDNDEQGRSGAEKLKKGLDDLKIEYYQLDLYQVFKDANETLMHDRDLLAEEVLKATDPERAEKEAYLNTSTANYIYEFLDGIAKQINTPVISTGFKKLDEELDGGLYEGLYFIGGIASLGKTSLALQIADQIAQSGQDVLIFSLEMARSELMSKSISRHTVQMLLEKKTDTRNAKTARGITDGARYDKYSQAEIQLIRDAVKKYSEYASHLFIHEGIGDIGTDQIRQTVEKHISITGNRPVVLIDYVQILAPHDVRASDKMNTDKSVLELKRISRDCKIPVIGISSFNRASYNDQVAMEAFKESGSLEYGSDVLIGLQLAGAGSKDFDSNKAKQKNPREIELVILKNRNGKTGAKIPFSYYPAFNYFF